MSVGITNQAGEYDYRSWENVKKATERDADYEINKHKEYQEEMKETEQVREAVFSKTVGAITTAAAAASGLGIVGSLVVYGVTELGTHIINESN